MNQFTVKPSPRELTPEILASILDGELAYEVYSFLIDVVHGDTDDETWVEAFRVLTPGPRAIFSTMLLEGEVCNGGFSQFFSNSSGRIAYEILEDCEYLGAHRCAGILREAIEREKAKGVLYSQFPDTGEQPLPEGIKPPDPAFNAWYATYDDLDGELYDASGEELFDLRTAYIRQHPEEFTGSLPR